ncbi:CheR family methyltransferase [Paenibacillus sp. GCM10023250]|uniref:CheR family methyltransferase n=1 Tax=Paenibacillus sp. GCM10023250 TaxID=3252648 RepID=UPI00360B9992
MEDKDFSLFIERIKGKTAIDLSLYKEAQMKRRLTTLRQKHGYDSFEAYYRELERDGKLMDEFLDRMTINVSEFWRNPGRWEAMERKFLPELLKQGGPLKIWSAACSTGEEPYTLSMIAHALGAQDRVSILATDLDSAVLQKAVLGVYPERSVRDVPNAYRTDYFVPHGSGEIAVADKLKAIVTFKRHNLLNDPFDGGFDIIVCRNVMIYFTEDAKHGLYRKFSRALKPGGLLFVGSTEQIFTPGQYELESEETFFYRRRS